MTTHEVLVAARNLIQRNGWVQVAFNKHGRFCMTGAINYVLAHDGQSGCEAWREPCRVLCSAIGWDYPTPMLWNDKKGRTVEEVLAAFDAAIAATAPPPADPLEDVDVAALAEVA